MFPSLSSSSSVMVSFLSVSLSLAVCGSLSLLLLSLSLFSSVCGGVRLFLCSLPSVSLSLCLTFFFLSAPFSSRLVVFCLLFCVLLGLVPRVCVCPPFPSFLPLSPFLLQFFSFFTFVLLFYLFLSLHLGLWFVFHQFCLLSFLFLLSYVIVYCLLCLYCFLFSSFVCFSFFYVTVCVSVCSNV